MAFYRTGGLALKSVKSILISPCFIVPSSVNLQVRHAARKGYREKVKRAKRLAAAMKPPPVANKELNRMKDKFQKIEKTVNQKKPEPPSDDIFMTDLFNYKRHTLIEAVTLHKEYLHPEIYNNPTAPVSVRIEIDMTGKKSTQLIKPFTGIIRTPHPFIISHKREILVLCKPENAESALASGASVAGGADIIKKIQEGVIQPSLFDYVIAHTDILPELTPVRQHLKEQFPKAKKGTLTNDLGSAIYRFLHGIEYSCIKIQTAKDLGLIVCHIGTLDMDPNHLEENFQTLVEDIESKRPPRGGDFISWIWCFCRPSDEEFSIDVSKYIKTPQIDDGDNEDTEVLTEKEEEKLALRKMLEERDEKELKI